MSNSDDDVYMSDEELDTTYDDVITTREIAETIRDMCKGTLLFQNLIEDDLYDFLYPQKEEESDEKEFL